MGTGADHRSKDRNDVVILKKHEPYSEDDFWESLRAKTMINITMSGEREEYGSTEHFSAK